MAYCTQAQVRAIVDTDMEDAEITELIAEIQAEMDLDLPTGSMSATLLQMVCRRKTAYDVFLKDPNASAAGEYREDRSKFVEALKARIDELETKINGGITFVVGYENVTDELEV